MGGQQRDVDTANLVFAALHNQTAGGFAFPQNYLVSHSLVFTLKEMLLRLVLHSEKLADAILSPSKSAQIVAAAALVDFQEKIFVLDRHRPDANGLPTVSFGHSEGF